MSIYDNGFNNLLTKDPLLSDTAQSTIEKNSSNSLTSGELTGNLTMSDGYMQSANFITGSAGWKIDKDGNVEFDNGYFRGDISSATGTFSNTLYVGDSKVEIDGEGTTYGYKIKDSSGNVIIFMGIIP